MNYTMTNRGKKAGAIAFVVFMVFLIATLVYIGYRSMKDSKIKYNEIKSTDATPASGTCDGGSPKPGSKLEFSASTCEIDCDESKDCVGYQWDSSCSLYTGTAPTTATAKSGANCYVKSV